MGTTVVPQKYMHRCDCCAKSEETASSSRPIHWAELIIAQDAYDYQGQAVADGTVKRLLCRECTAAATIAINETMKQFAA